MKALKITGVVVGVLIAGILVFAKVNHVAPLSMVSPDEFDTSDGIALQGYDPVSYFTSGEAVKGSEDIQYVWKNAIWFFSSDENKTSFINNPQQYAPQFGGYCGFAVSTGFSATANPEVFKIRNDKPYLFNNADVVAEAEKGGESFWTTAESNWNK